MDGVVWPVGLALYGRSNRKSVALLEAVPLRSAPPTSGVYRLVRRQRGHAIQMLAMAERDGVPVRRSAMGVRSHLAAAIANRAWTVIQSKYWAYALHIRMSVGARASLAMITDL
eukprot:6213061-Pleurochrysis_carterae.AAC.10